MVTNRMYFYMSESPIHLIKGKEALIIFLI